jgi:hypothetical protein
MECAECKLDRPEEHIVKDGVCYKCVYDKKIKKLKECGRYVDLSKKIKTIKEKKCNNCGKDFKSNTAKYCSKKCVDKALRQSRVIIHNNYEMNVTAIYRSNSRRWKDY